MRFKDTKNLAIYIEVSYVPGTYLEKTGERPFHKKPPESKTLFLSWCSQIVYMWYIVRKLRLQT